MSNSAAKPEKEAGQQLDNALHHLVNDYMSSDILKALLVFRFLNALSVVTFFQPDEYYQSLEPAWQMAFGSDSGAWITWARNSHLSMENHDADINKIGMASSIALFAASCYICLFLLHI